MINRSLIRQKVVQSLYPYLLTKSDFSIISLPGRATRDRHFAQTVYIALLQAIERLCGYGSSPIAKLCPKPLQESTITKSLSSNTDLKAQVEACPEAESLFDDILPNLLQQIKSSAAYRSFTHSRSRDIPEEAEFWKITLETVFAHSLDFEKACRKAEGFTIGGMTKGIELAVETLESYANKRKSFTDALASLEASLSKSRELYMALLWLSVELVQLQDERIDAARNKYLPSEEDLNPSLRFVDNAFIKAIAENPEIVEFRKDNPFTWREDPIFLEGLLDKITASKTYKKYMASADTDAKADAELWRDLYETIILPSDEIAEFLETKSLYWNDDMHIIGTFILKTVKQIKVKGEEVIVNILPKYKDEEDARFGAELFTYVVKNKEEYAGYIDRFLTDGSWDSDRIAFMDFVIMQTAIAEMMNFPSVPIPVSLNEYIEIAHHYSTPRSGHFINGILYSVITYLREQKLLLKPDKSN